MANLQSLDYMNISKPSTSTSQHHRMTAALKEVVIDL
jgi:hypothetical protein